MMFNEKIELFDKWYDENYDEWAEGEEGIALREELEQAFKSGIATLEKENAELKKSCDETQELLDKQRKRIVELEQQIEKMKNWCNCKNYQQCLIELAEQGKGMNTKECCVNCKKWEIKENV